MKPCITYALLCQLVDIRRADLSTKAAAVGEAQIIGNDDQEVRAL